MKYSEKLTNNEASRYARQIIVDKIGIEGQLKIRDCRVLVIGLGGLGSPVASYLVGAGFGTIGIADFDTLEIHNLQRQIIHSEKFIGSKKVQSALDFLKSFNSSVKIIPHDLKINTKNICEILEQYDIVLDCTDCIDARYIINDCCRKKKKDLVSASVLKWEGQIFVLPCDGPCYRCMFPIKKKNFQNCDEGGVIGSACGIIGSIQATEAIKMIVQKKDSKLITLDAYNLKLKHFDLSNSKKCSCSLSSKWEDDDQKINEETKKKIDESLSIEWSEVLSRNEDYIIVDIRKKILYDISHYNNSINISSEEIEEDVNQVKSLKKDVFLLCKRGISAKKLCDKLRLMNIKSYYIYGGLTQYKKEIDNEFPI